VVKRFFAIFLLVLIACSDEPSAGDAATAADTGFVPDGGDDDPPDTGRVDTGLIDTGLPDSGQPDIGAPDTGIPPEGAVTVQVLDFVLGPRSGVRIIAGRTDGVMLEEVTTDGLGMAELDVPSGGTITAAIEDEFSGRYVFHAVLGVEPGDHLTFGEQRPAASPSTQQLEITFDGAYPSANQHDLAFGCHLSTVRQPQTGAISIDYPPPGCTATSSVTVLLTAYGDSGLLAYAGRVDVPISATGSTAIDLSPWQTPSLPLDVRVTNRPDHLGYAIGSAAMVGGQRYVTAGRANYVSTSSSVAETLLLPDFGDGLEIVVQSGFGRYAQVTSRGPRVSTFSVDGATDFLPPITAVEIEEGPDGRPEFRRTTAATAADLDATLIGLSWPDIGEIDAYARWQILIPPDAPDTLRAPELPSDLQDAGRPPPFLLGANVLLFEADYLDYAGVRNGPTLMLDQITIPPGVNGRMRRTH
jgi:hypothetical protein